VITSGGNRNPAKLDVGAGNRTRQERINTACPSRPSADATVPSGRWRYVYRAIDQFGQVIDVYVSPRRDGGAARCFFTRALATTKVVPVEVTTDKAAVYPHVLDELAPTSESINLRSTHGGFWAYLGCTPITSAIESSSPTSGPQWLRATGRARSACRITTPNGRQAAHDAIGAVHACCSHTSVVFSRSITILPSA
jgi:hypothetical protein